MKPKSLPSRLFDRNSAAASEETSTSRAAKYQRHVDCMDPPETLNQSSHDDGLQATDDSGRKDKWHRELHFAFLPERYKPLIDDEEKARANREKKKRKKENYKKVKKNVGKALRITWKCLMLGLHNFALGYSTPITVAATFVPDFHHGNRT
ncbi:required for drug-induced death protein 1 isoform X1 [Cololabis saira]|uniref:required for drug-induced death protein 1 isoform X1 n=1 Tax=Cololabis saira TaxID=129043 RepID=UPI002AD2654A|nr:required for drug-induced death protein 1 isoform X1 [Cololabis saira]